MVAKKLHLRSKNGFDCKVLREEEREPDAGITLFGAAFGSSNYIVRISKKFSAKVQDILGSFEEMKNTSDRLSLTARLCIHLSGAASSTQYPTGSVKNLCVRSGHNFPRGFAAIHNISLPYLQGKKLFLDSSLSTHPSGRPRYITCIVNSRSSIGRVCH